MRYLPDTNVWIEFLNPGENAIKRRIGSMLPGQLVVCSVVKAELYFGAERSARQQENRNVLDGLFSELQSLPFDDTAAMHYARVRAQLAALGMPIGPHDLMIAAIALAHDLTVVTRNTREFSRVTDLKSEDWEGD